MVLRKLLVGIFLLGAGCHDRQPPAGDAALDALLSKINERLALMEPVAQTKFRKGLPAQDTAREEVLLRAVEAKATEVGQNPKSVRWFFSAQIEAAKILQESHFQRWRGQGPPDFTNATDIFELRQRIDRLNDELIACLAEYRKHPSSRKRIEERARTLIQGAGIDDEIRSKAIQPLLEKE